MIRTKNRYITLEYLLIQMIDKGITFVNPFANFDIFKITDTGYNIDGDDLLRLLTMKYKERYVGREIPCIGRKYINHLLPNSVDTIENEEDQINYVYKFLYNQIIIFLEENKDNYTRIMEALTAKYNPIENYNMVEYSGSASKVSDTKSTPGNVTATTKVAPFTDDNQNLHQTITSALKSTAGYEDASQSMQWASGDKYTLPYQIVTAGRNQVMDKVLKACLSPTILEIEALTQSEAIAFVISSINFISAIIVTSLKQDRIIINL